MKSVDHALWERELAEYLSLHPTLKTCRLRCFPDDGHDCVGGYAGFGRYAGLGGRHDRDDPESATCS